MTIAWGDFSASVPEIIWLYIAIVAMMALVFRS